MLKPSQAPAVMRYKYRTSQGKAGSRSSSAENIAGVHGSQAADVARAPKGSIFAVGDARARDGLERKTSHTRKTKSLARAVSWGPFSSWWGGRRGSTAETATLPRSSSQGARLPPPRGRWGARSRRGQRARSAGEETCKGGSVAGGQTAGGGSGCRDTGDKQMARCGSELADTEAAATGLPKKGIMRGSSIFRFVSAGRRGPASGGSGGRQQPVVGLGEGKTRPGGRVMAGGGPGLASAEGEKGSLANLVAPPLTKTPRLAELTPGGSAGAAKSGNNTGGNRVVIAVTPARVRAPPGSRRRRRQPSPNGASPFDRDVEQANRMSNALKGVENRRGRRRGEAAGVDGGVEGRVPEPESQANAPRRLVFKARGPSFDVASMASAAAAAAAAELSSPSSS